MNISSMFYNFKKDYLNSFIFKKISLLYLVCLFPIILADYAYRDDIRRIAIGFRGWENYHRHVSNLLSIPLHTNEKIFDISPLTQILAVIVMAIAATILINIFVKEKNNHKYCLIISSIVFCFSPFFLSCLSYKYDSIYMALSVLFPIIPFLLMSVDDIYIYIYIANK